MIVILGLLSAGLIGLAIIFVVIRLVFDWRLTIIQREPDQSLLFRRKVIHLRRIEQARHIRYLLLTCLIIGAGLLLFIGSFLFIVDDYQNLKARNTRLEDRVENFEIQQKQLIASIPLKKYPEEGIGLTDYEWDKLAAEEKDSKLQKKMEAAVSQKSVPYFGSSDTKVSLSDPEIVTLQLRGWTDDDASIETIKKNLDAFAKEAEEIPELLAVHAQLITSNEKDGKVVYSVTYSREKSEDVFHKKNVSEQNLKNDGGKG